MVEQDDPSYDICFNRNRFRTYIRSDLKDRVALVTSNSINDWVLGGINPINNDALHKTTSKEGKL